MNYKFTPMNSQVYAFNDYRDALRALMEARKCTHPQFTYGELARAIQVQAPYLSRVLRKDAQLSSDQLHLVCETFHLNSDETEFIFLLLEHQRSGLLKRRKQINEEIVKRRQAQREIKKHLKAETVAQQDALRVQEYFLDPLALLVHCFLMVPAFAKAPAQIARHLAISADRLEVLLKRLERLGMIEFQSPAKGYRILKDHLHLERESGLNQAYQILFRFFSAEFVQRLDPKNKKQFTLTLTADEHTRKVIDEEFTNFLRRIEPLVRKAPSEGVYQMNFDLFRWDQAEVPLNHSRSRDEKEFSI